jgi:hypothetical protein
LERAQPAVITEDYTEAVTWLFAALEAAIVAVADAQGIDTEKQHWKKAEVAKQLHDSGVIPHDFSDTLAFSIRRARRLSTRARSRILENNRSKTWQPMSNEQSSLPRSWGGHDRRGHGSWLARLHHRGGMGSSTSR